MKWDKFKRLLFDYLQQHHLGSENPIPVRQLAGQFQVSSRQIHLLINEMRKQGVPIGSSRRKPYGIYLISSDTDREKTFREIYATCRNILDVVNALNRKKAPKKIPKPIEGLNDWNNQKLVVLNYLYRHTRKKEKVLPARVISRELNIPPRDIYRLVHALRKDGYPIISSRTYPFKGFYYGNQVNQKEYCCKLLSSISDELKRVTAGMKPARSTVIQQQAHQLTQELKQLHLPL